MAAMEIEPEKFPPQYKVHKIVRVGVKTRVGRVSGGLMVLKAIVYFG